MKNIFQTRKNGNPVRTGATLFVPSRTFRLILATLWNNYIINIYILTN